MRLDDINKLTQFHDQLNQNLWDGEELRKDVQYHLLLIAKEFIKFINIPDFELEDITISGSNCSYNYNDQSDIDLHLIVDGEGPCWKHLNELFLAKKNLFNDEHDITLKGADVEVYVQDKNQPHISNGIYSIMRDTWIKKPQKITAEPDQTNIQHKFNHIKHQIMLALQSDDPEVMSDVQTKIKNYRKSGLDKNGEFGAENLAFKMIRNAGLIQALWDAKKKAEDNALSLAEGWEDKLNRLRDAEASDRGNLGKKGVIDPTNNTPLEPGEADQPEDPEHALAETPPSYNPKFNLSTHMYDRGYGVKPPTQWSDVGRNVDINPDKPTVIGPGGKKQMAPGIKGMLKQQGRQQYDPGTYKDYHRTDYSQDDTDADDTEEPIDENFADGKGPGRPGDSQRHGIPKGATMAELEKASHAEGRKGQLARWQINMRRGKKKANESLTPADPVEKWIATFKKSTHPKFAGKTPEQREKQARMAHYRAVQNKKTVKEAGGPDMSRRGFLGGLGALVASSGLPKPAASALEQILQITTPEHLENINHQFKSSGKLLQFSREEFDKIYSATRGIPLDDWGGWRNPRIDLAYKHLTGEEMKAARIVRILKDNNIDPAKFFDSPSVRAVIDKVHQEWAAKWAQQRASEEPFKDPDYEPPKMDDKKVKKLEKKRDKAYKELTAKNDDKRMKGTAVGRMGPIQSPLKPTHISPSGVATNMSPEDDDYEINYGAKGVASKPKGKFVKPITHKVNESLVKEPFKDPVAVLKKNLDKMPDPDWDKIDLLMKKIANHNGIDVNMLHKMWVDEYDETPDEYCEKISKTEQAEIMEAGALPIYYFSYGMLTDPNNMEGAQLIGPAVLNNFQFELFAHANVFPNPGSGVVGVLWEIDRNLLGILDQIEGYGHYYDRKTVPVFCRGKRYEAELYTMTPASREASQGKTTTQRYVDSLVRGYQNAGIPLTQIVTAFHRDQPKDIDKQQHNR